MFALIWEAMCCILVVPEIMVGSKTFRTPLYIAFNEVPLVDVHVSVQSLLTLKPLFEFRASFTCTFIWFRVHVCGLMSRQLRFISEFLFACLALPFFLIFFMEEDVVLKPRQTFKLFHTALILTSVLVLPPMPANLMGIKFHPVCKPTWWVTNSTYGHPFLTNLVQSVLFEFKYTN